MSGISWALPAAGGKHANLHQACALGGCCSRQRRSRLIARRVPRERCHGASLKTGAHDPERSSGLDESPEQNGRASEPVVTETDDQDDLAFDAMWKVPIEEDPEHEFESWSASASWYDSIWKDSFTEEQRRPSVLPMEEAVRFWLSSEITLLLEIIGTLLLVACFALDTVDLNELQSDVLAALEFDVSLYFVALYLGRWYTKGLRVSYLFKPFMVIDFLSLLPLVVENLSFGAFLRIFRILRFARLLQEEELSRLVTLLTGRVIKFKNSQVTALQVFFTLFSVIVITAGVVYQCEHKTSPESFGNFFDALYFSIMTLTSVGYGDIVPTTAVGKTVTSFAVLAYAVLIPYELALLAQTMGLMAEGEGDSNRPPKVAVSCRSCGMKTHEVDSVYCRICGKRLESP